MDNYVCSYCVHSKLIYFLFSISTGPEDRRKQHSDSLSGSTTWLVALQHFCRFFDFTTNMTFPLRTEGLMLQLNLYVKIGASYGKHKGQKQLIEYGCDDTETSASTLHQPMKHAYMCTLSMRRGRKRNKIVVITTFGQFAILTSSNCLWVREERGQTKEGEWNTNQRQNTDCSHSPARSLV